MSKRNRKQGLIGGANFAQSDVAKAFGKALTADASVIGIVKNNCKAIEQCNGIRALDGTELRHLAVAIENLEDAQRRLLAIGKRVHRRGSKT